MRKTMKIIETLYRQNLQSGKQNMKYRYLERYFQDTAVSNFCFLKLKVNLELKGAMVSGSLDKIGNTGSTYGVLYDQDFKEIKKIIDIIRYSKVYAFSQMDIDRDTKHEIIKILNEDIEGALIPLFLKCEKNPDSLELLMVYISESIPDMDLIKEALLEGTINRKFPVLVGVIMAETVSINPLPQFKDNLDKLSPMVSSDENVFNYIMKRLKFPDSRTFLTIANTKYESQENCGEVVLYKVINTKHYDLDLFSPEIKNFVPDPNDTNIAGLENGCKIEFKEACAMNWENAREVRKYLEMSSKEMPLVIAGFFRDFPNDFGAKVETNWKVYGLAGSDLKTYDAKVSFHGGRGFDIGFQYEWIFYDGVSYQFFRKGVENDIITEQINNVNFLTSQEKELIVAIIKEASKQHHGTMLVFHKEAKKEAERLGKCGRALELEPFYIQNEIRNLVQLASIDGALMIDFNGMCYALGAILDGNASENSKRGRGARYNSGLAYVDTQYQLDNSCLVVVISEDGSIDVLVCQKDK